MPIRLLALVTLILPLIGCGQQQAPKVSIEAGDSAKKKVITMNDEHQKKLEQLTLPGAE